MANAENTYGLTPKQAIFVAEYLVDLNATQAAVRAGYSQHTAQEQSSRLLSNARVSEAIAASQIKRAEKLEIKAEFVLQRWYEIATADPNELVQYRRGPCGDCWQSPDEKAANDRPRPHCQRCSGEGEGRVFVHDTRNLSGHAKRLYAGVKANKDGLQVLMRDQDAALLNIARHIGMFVEQHRHSGSFTLGKPEEMTEEQIEARLVALRLKRGADGAV